MLISSFIYAGTTILLACCCYLFVSDVATTTHHTLVDRLIWQHARHLRNSIRNVAFLPLVQLMLPLSIRRSLVKLYERRIVHLSGAALQNICLVLADTQLITGASLLIVLRLKTNSVSRFDYCTVTSLASMALVSYQAIFVIVADKAKDTPLYMRLWRSLWLLVLFVGVGFTNTSIYSKVFSEETHEKAWCKPMATVSLKDITDFALSRTITANLIVENGALLWGLCSILSILFPGLTNRRAAQAAIAWAHFLLWWPARRKLQRRLPTGFLRDASNFCWLALATVALSIREVLFSHALTLLRVIYMFASGLQDILGLRSYSISWCHGFEGNWGFGQVLSLLLLALPVSSFLDELWSMSPLCNGFICRTT